MSTAEPLGPANAVKEWPGEFRVGPVFAIPALLTELGVRSERAFARAGVDSRLFEDPGSRISLQALGNLFDTCVAPTECAHFGMLVGERFDMKGFGQVG